MTVSLVFALLLVVGVAVIGVGLAVLLVLLLRTLARPDARTAERHAVRAAERPAPGPDASRLDARPLGGHREGDLPGTEDFDFGQQIDFAQNGGDYLHYLSQTFETDASGRAVRPLTMETGFWRPQPDGGLEVVMCHPDGFAEVWYGTITGAKIELATDAVVRTASAAGLHGGAAALRQRRGRPAVDLRQGGERAAAAVAPVGPAAAASHDLRDRRLASTGRIRAVAVLQHVMTVVLESGVDAGVPWHFGDPMREQRGWSRARAWSTCPTAVWSRSPAPTGWAGCTR